MEGLMEMLMAANKGESTVAGQEATIYEIKQGAAWIRLNRPENRNALSRSVTTKQDRHAFVPDSHDWLKDSFRRRNRPELSGG